MVYSKTYCPYSIKLKKLLNAYAISDLKVVELDKQKEMKAMQGALKRITGRSTVPLLFIGGEFVGGHDEVRKIEDRGELRKLLEKAQAL
ncbi:Glutaredoxin [Teladorsagia circumcincta]|uniref:Glutaredoxin n=1 Tax=Teladorsagia circumcincta TaxID=45464 RepID=A0A2G9UKB0_TELCI|nr:Glutaredoxin [Teladorsagia circumcincta]